VAGRVGGGIEDNAGRGGPVITAGKIIEIGDIDVIGIPTEDTGTSLYSSNSMLFGGLIPLFQANTAVTNSSTRVFLRATYNADDMPIVLLRGNGWQNRLPVFRRGIILGTSAAAAPTLAQLFPTFNLVEHSRHASSGNNVLATSFGANFRHIQDGNLRVWSSYRTERRNTNGTSSWYLIPSLRPTFGLYARLFSSLHPAQRVP